MKYILFIAVQFLMWQHVQAQQLSGKIINTDKQPVGAANVLLLNGTDTSLVKAIIAKDDGSFAFKDIPQASYLLRISNTGYQNRDTFFVFSQPQANLTITLNAAATELHTVVVRSQKALIQQTAEGVTLNVDKSILSKGSNALQLLERSPGVMINRRDNSIQLNGKNGVSVMLNGRLMHMSESQLIDLLSGISADNIASIELLTSPSAKYDAEGSAGIINIVLKKNRMNGTSGSVTFSAGYGYREKASGGFTLAHNTSKVSWYSSYMFSRNHTYSNMYIDSRQNMPFLGGNVHALGWDTTYAIQNNHNATAGVDVRLSNKTTVGASIIFTNNTSSSKTGSHMLYNVVPDSVLKFDGRNTGGTRWNNIVSSAYLERRLGKNGKLNAGADYLYFQNNDPYKVQGTFVNKYGEAAGNSNALSAPQQSGFAATDIHVLAGKIDYSNQLNEKLLLEAGIKNTGTLSQSHSGFESLVNGVWTSNAQSVSHIRMKENIYAVYASLRANISPSAALTAGLRYEHATTNMNDTKTTASIASRRLGTLFPDLFFSKKLPGSSSLQLSYTRRITRPSYNDLASYVGYSDPTAVYTGNPFLLPTLSQNISVGYTHKKYAASVSYSRDRNTISRYQLSESANHDMLIISPQNIAWQNNILFHAGIPVIVNSWWQMNYDFSGGWHQYRVNYVKQPFINAYFGYTFTYSQVFKIQHEYNAEISASYNNASYDGTKKVDGFVIVNLGIKKELKKNGGSLQLSASDVLRQQQYNIRYGLLTQEAYEIQNHVRVKTESMMFPVIRLTYIKSFGSNTFKSKGQNSLHDEQERIRKE